MNYDLDFVILTTTREILDADILNITDYKILYNESN